MATTPSAPASGAAAALTDTQLALITIARLALTIAFRIVYPLQPFLTQSLHVDLQTVSMLVTVQLLASLISPLGGTLSDSRGERAVMSIGLGLFCAGALFCALSGAFPGFLAGYTLIGLGFAFFQPAATAYLSARTSYERRGRALGIFETSWAGAALLGVAPLMLLVQVTQSTQPVYWTLFVLGCASLVLVLRALPPTPGRQSGAGKQRIEWHALRSISVIAMLAMLAMIQFAYDVYGVVQGAWLKQDFGADEARLGQMVGVIGVAELVGAVAVAALADRLGKKRAAIGGFVFAAACLALLPLSAGNWELLLVLLFLFSVAEEFAIVAAIPLLSGVAPRARGTVLSLSVTIGSLGRSLGALISTPLWLAAGIGANTLLAAGLTLAAAALCGILVRETEALEVESGGLGAPS